MLSEARARLANTKGKKAKRKAREKQLEEARRLASLQKRRELKAAGIELPKHKRKIKGIDYTKEIPFQKKPPPGFYEVDYSDQEQSKEPFKPVGVEQVDSKRKRQMDQEQEQKDMQKKQKNKAEKDLPSVLQQINQLTNPNTTNRSKLILPTPQLSEQELQELSKNNGIDESLLSQFEDEENGTNVTKSLLPNYNATPQITLPQRTPMRTQTTRTPMREDHLLREAQNLVALTAQQTPLAGGDNPLLHNSDFTGATPKPIDVRTPNLFATPRVPSTSSSTTTRNAIGNNTNRRDFATPLSVRDTLSINEDKSILYENKHAEKQKKEEIRRSLASLPAPQNEYKIMVPDTNDENEEIENKEEIDDEMDEGDRLRLQQQRIIELEQLKLRLRSAVLKRENLPRPVTITTQYKTNKSKQQDNYLQQAEDSIRNELITIITHEALEYPFKNSKITPKHAIGLNEYDQFTEQELDAANLLLNDELTSMAVNFPFEDFEKINIEMDEELIYVPSLGRIARSSQLKNKEKIECIIKEFEDIKGIMVKEATKAKKTVGKLAIYNGGYEKRSQTLLQQINELYVKLSQTKTEHKCFLKLKEFEDAAMPTRLEKLQEEVKLQEEREAANQKRYLDLITERNSLYQNVQMKAS